MEAKNLRSLMIKHFGFLAENYGFRYDDTSCSSASCSYVKNDLKIEVQHMNGALNLLFISKETTKSLPELMSEVLKSEFTYPAHFSSWVLSMGDVDSRLAYDAKLMQKYADEIFRVSQ